MIRQGELTTLAGRLGVMDKRIRQVQDAPRISDRAPGRLHLPSAEIRKATFGAGLKSWRSHLGPTEFETCVRLRSQEVLYCNWIYESGFQKRGPSRSNEFRSCQSENEFLVIRAREAKHPLVT